MTLQHWIDGLIADRYKTTRAFAAAIGMTESGFARAAKAGTFDVENCLRLAVETGQSAETVFTLAGKPQVHELIERLYGPVRPARHPDAVKGAELLTQIDDPDARAGFLQMMRGYLKAQAAASAEATRATPAPRRR